MFEYASSSFLLDLEFDLTIVWKEGHINQYNALKISGFFFENYMFYCGNKIFMRGVGVAELEVDGEREKASIICERTD